MNWFSRFFQLSFNRKIILIEASFYLTYWYLIVKFLPFKWYTSFLGKQVDMPILEQDFQIDQLKLIKKGIYTGSKYLPWKIVCFPQALAAKSMLNRRGIKSTLYLGAARHQQKLIDLHSWLDCGSYTVTGGQLKKQYKAVKIYQ